NGFVTWTVTCPATETECTGLVKLTTTTTTLRAAIARRRKAVNIGQARYSLKGGETKKVRVKVDGRGRRLVRKHHQLPAKATFHTHDTSGHQSRQVVDL